MLALTIPGSPFAGDTDKDGLSDAFEQQLLEKFVPRFFVHRQDCDVSPAEFHSGFPDPRMAGRNGTIYGQVFPIQVEGRAGPHIEIHYYHLWNQDCGLNGHALDAEHVSVMVAPAKAPTPAPEWIAGYWYAAAHEDTACDASHAGKSSFLKAETQGPRVWIAAGKHASYLDSKLCRRGCGSDDCEDARPLSITKILNIGEPTAPANGALWIAWPGWPLAAKMKTDFPETMLRKLDLQETDALMPANNSQAPMKTVVLVGSSTAKALVSADQGTDAAALATKDAVASSVKKSTKGTGSAIGGTFRAVWRALEGISHGLTSPPAKPE